MRRGLQRARLGTLDVVPDKALREALSYLLVSSGDRMRVVAHRNLSDHGVTWPQHLLLLVLSRIEGLSQETLASRTGIDRSTVASSLADLEYEGAVVRTRDMQTEGCCAHT